MGHFNWKQWIVCFQAAYKTLNLLVEIFFSWIQNLWPLMHLCRSSDVKILLHNLSRIWCRSGLNFCFDWALQGFPDTCIINKQVKICCPVVPFFNFFSLLYIIYYCFKCEWMNKCICENFNLGNSSDV